MVEKNEREEIPLVSHHHPDFNFPANTMNGWIDERIEHFELKEDIGVFRRRIYLYKT